MPSWGKIASEIQAAIAGGDQHAFDTVRNRYLRELSNHTQRNTIIYASRWASGDAPPNLVSITDEDIAAFMEAIHGLKGRSLDLIIHTPGGSAEATDAIVTYLRQKFDDLRIFIPQAAMSAGTMLACSANTIVMGKHSSIGPIDPQMMLNTPLGLQSVPAHAILAQFKAAQKDCAENPKNLNSWLPMLSQYGPGMLVQCKNQIVFGRELVATWLQNFMFKGEVTDKPTSIAEYLSNHDNFKTHAKHLDASVAEKIGLKVFRLETDQVLQEKVLSVFHATIHAFSGTPATKITCNQDGSAFIKNLPMLNMGMGQMPLMVRKPNPPPGIPPPPIKVN